MCREMLKAKEPETRKIEMAPHVAPSKEVRDLVRGAQSKGPCDGSTRRCSGKGTVQTPGPEQLQKWESLFTVGGVPGHLSVRETFQQLVIPGLLLHRAPGFSVQTRTSFLLCLSLQTNSETSFPIHKSLLPFRCSGKINPCA